MVHRKKIWFCPAERLPSPNWPFSWAWIYYASFQYSQPITMLVVHGRLQALCRYLPSLSFPEECRLLVVVAWSQNGVNAHCRCQIITVVAGFELLLPPCVTLIVCLSFELMFGYIFNMFGAFHGITPFLLLLGSQQLLVSAQTSSGSFQFPVEDKLTINFIDTIVLQWTSNYLEAYLLMWCQNGTTGNNVVLGLKLHGAQE